MKYIFINDVHMGAVYQLYKTVEEFQKDLSAIMSKEQVGKDRVFPIGDNYDMNNCKKKDVDALKLEGDRFKNLFGKTFIAGNHEIGIFGNDPEFAIIETPQGRVLVTHGDLPFWGRAKAYEYRNSNKAGAGLFKRLFGKVTNEIRESIPVKKLDQDFLDRAKMYMDQYKCKTMICGHKHPQETVVEEHDGYKFIVLKRGINVVEL